MLTCLHPGSLAAYASLRPHYSIAPVTLQGNVCTCMCVFLSLSVCLSVCLCPCLYPSLAVCVYISIIHVSIFACLHLCLYPCYTYVQIGVRSCLCDCLIAVCHNSAGCTCSNDVLHDVRTPHFACISCASYVGF